MKSEKGAILIWTAAAALFLVGLTAAVVDIGLIAYEKRELQKTADMGALAGAQLLPGEPNGAIAEAETYVAANGAAEDEITSITVGRQNTEVTVQLSRTVPLYLAHVFGYASTEVAVQAKARVGIKGGVVPWGHEAGDLVYGKEYTMKWGSGHSSAPLHGNFHVLNYPGQMNIKEYEEWVKHGYPGEVYVGAWYDTKTGNLGVSTKNAVQDRMNRAKGMNCSADDLENLDPECPTIVTVPLVKTFVDMNGKGEVQVIQFVRFLITRMTQKSSNVTIYGVYLDPEQSAAGRIPKVVYLVE